MLDFKRDILYGMNINAKRHIIEDTLGKNATLRLARYKIDALGNVKSHNCILNNEDTISKLKNKLKLSKLMSFITKKDKKSQSKKEIKDINKLYSIGFYAVQKLMKTNKPKKITKKELWSVLFLCLQSGNERKYAQERRILGAVGEGKK